MLIKNIVLCVQTVVIIVMAITSSKMSGYVDRSLKIARQSEENAQNAIVQAKKSIEISKKYQEKIAWYEKEYGIVIMPGETKEFSYSVPLK